MQQDTSLSWLFFFIFQVILCFFGLFSQLIFLKTTAFDKKIYVTGRVHLFFLSLGYQSILVTFLGMTVVCLHFGSMFEVEECREARMIPLKLHNYGEFTVVIFHLLVNLDRLLLAFRPFRSQTRGTKVYFYASIFASFILSAVYVEWAHHEDFRKSIAFTSICLVNVMNLLIEFKLYHYTSVVFTNTIGVVPLERRFELSTSVSMIRCFLPASICGVMLKFIVLVLFSLAMMMKDPADLPPIYFVLNVFWNLDCTLFPWFFIIFHPKKKQKLMSFLKIESNRNSSVPETYQRQKTQMEHFNQFKGVWKIEV